MNTQLIAWLVVLCAFILVFTTKTRSTCTALFSFICALGLVLWQSFSYWLKGGKKRITALGRKLIYTEGREWLDETEQQITE